MNCPKCNTPCDRDEVDVGVGVVTGPWGCSNCHWSEDERYDLSDGRSNQRDGGTIDERGGFTPAPQCEHKWRDGYYGVTCEKCGHQHVYGCEPWAAMVDDGPTYDEEYEDE